MKRLKNGVVGQIEKRYPNVFLMMKTLISKGTALELLYQFLVCHWAKPRIAPLGIDLSWGRTREDSGRLN